MTNEFEVAGVKYQAGRLQLFDQTAIARRLAPVVKKCLTREMMQQVIDAKAGGTLDIKKIDIFTVIPALADAVYSLSDEDIERIVRTALKVVKREVNGTNGMQFSPVMAQQGAMMFEDLNDFGTTMQIVWYVVSEHLDGFFPSTPSNS